MVVDEYQRALGFCYSNEASITAAIETGIGTYWSRRRGLWRKGASSGNTQEVLRIDIDCDRDALRLTVRQKGPGFCHTDAKSCWGPLSGLPQLAATLSDRQTKAPSGSYTKRLFDEPELLACKLMEEAQELLDAQNPSDAVWETADLLYFALVAMTARGGQLEDVIDTLNQRAQSITRRSGDAKNQGGTRG